MNIKIFEDGLLELNYHEQQFLVKYLLNTDLLLQYVDVKVLIRLIHLLYSPVFEVI